MVKKNTDINKNLKDKLFNNKKNGWNGLDDKIKKEVFSYSEEYKDFISSSKTEQLSILNIKKQALKKGFKDIKTVTKNDKKIFINYRNSACVLAIINNKKFKDGFTIVSSHIDTPRLDLKGAPLYEAESMAYLKTRYYGGIKKYQWVTIPMALHGVVYKKDGTILNFSIGEKENEPVFTVNDLLIHLAQNQMTKSASNVIEGEQLNILVGSIPYKFKSDKDSVKIYILDYLNKEYGITESDFISSNIYVVPAGKARDVGLDRSFIGAYGQDDRVCVFTSLKAILDSKNNNKNLLAIFFDKEEVGSNQDTGANSNLMIRIVADLMDIYGVENHKSIIKTLESSKALSADVTAGTDPEWRDVLEPMNAAKICHGVAISKYGGGRGKGGASETHARFVSEIRSIFDKAKVNWQIAELGKVDHGGGGTLSKFLAFFGMDVLDCGTPLLSMHSTFEIASKIDIYNTYKAYKAFFDLA